MYPLGVLTVPLTVQSCITNAFTYMPSAQLLNMCAGSYGTQEEAMALWEITGAGRVLDCIVANYAKDEAGTDWLKEVLKAGGLGTGGMDCSTLTGAGCEIAPDICEDLVREGKGSIFWILKAVSIMNLWFVDIHETWIQDAQAAKMMDVYEIEKDFEVKTVDDDGGKKEMANNIGLAFSLGAAALSLMGPAGAIGSVVVRTAGIFSLGATATSLMTKFQGDSPEEPPEVGKQVEYAMRDYFNQTAYQMRRMMHDAIGIGDQRNLTEFLTETDRYTTPTAQFFAEGKWLVQNVGQITEPLIKEAGKHLKEKLILDALRAQGVHMFITDKKGWNNDTCERKWGSEKGRVAQRWMKFERVEYCVAFEEKDNCTLQHKDQQTALVEKYGLNISTIFQSIWDCNRHPPEGGKNNNIQEGSLFFGYQSHCLYPMGVRYDDFYILDHNSAHHPFGCPVKTKPKGWKKYKWKKIWIDDPFVSVNATWDQCKWSPCLNDSITTVI